MINLKHLGAALVVGLLVLSQQSASAQFDSGRYKKIYSLNSYAGGKVTAFGYMNHTGSSSEVYGRIRNKVRLLGHGLEAGRVIASGSQSYSEGTGQIQVRMGGQTVWSSTLASSGSKSFQRVFKLFNPSPKKTIWLGPVPVTLRGNVSAGVSLDLNWTLVASTLSAGLSGRAKAWGLGTGSATVGVPGYNVSLEARLRFANAKLVHGLNANLAGISGYLRYVHQSIRLLLNLVVTAWPFEWETELVDHSSPKKVKRLL